MTRSDLYRPGRLRPKYRAGSHEVRRHWVIVRRDRPELFTALSLAYLRRRSYVVIMDRRVGATERRGRPVTTERRRLLADVQPFAIVPAKE